MKETKDPRQREKNEGPTHQKRWHRNVDGTYRYKGKCPFNRSVCWLINSFAQIECSVKEGMRDGG